MDLVGSLITSTSKHRFILVVVDYTTLYPKTMPLRMATATAAAHALAMLFTRVGFSKQVVTNQGTDFMVKLLKALAQLVGLRALRRTTIYHPQTNGFNGTLRWIIFTFVPEGNKDWHKW